MRDLFATAKFLFSLQTLSDGRCASRVLTIFTRSAIEITVHYNTFNSYCRAAYAVVRCLSVTFVYCVETAKDAAIFAMECE